MNVSPATIFARPTADRIWLGPSQQKALSQLSGRQPVKALLGPGSSGKTTLLRHLAERDDSAVRLRLRAPCSGPAGLLAKLLQSAGLDPWELSVVEQRNLFAVLVQQRHSQGRQVAVSIDNAERLGAPECEELERLLSLSGLSLSFAANAANGPSAALHALIESSEAATHVLTPLSDREIDAYVAWRLGVYGLTDVFTRTALRLLSRAAQGRFTAVDLISQMALLVMRKRGGTRVDARVLQEATRALGGHRPATDGPATEAADGHVQSPPALAGRIVATRDGEVHATHALGPRVLIGRSEHNDLCLPSPYLSRHHAVVVGTTDGYYVVDLNSVNGLLLNGHLVRRAVLRDGDILGVGPFRLKVEVPGQRSTGNPLPAQGSLDDTAVMPPQPRRQPAVRIIK